ncbi:MAG: tetratricopeptide repeat protein [Oligoflexales bacterium]|nr:tetratricopeptide repeat protein [Oligoflexales bacterium]
MKKNWAFWLSLPLFTACINQNERLREDLFNVQTRLLTLERKTEEKGQAVLEKGEATNKRMAAAGTRLEQLEAEVARARGELDALREGLKLGKLPGQTDDEPSIAKNIKDLWDRLHSLEAAQADMLKALEEFGKKKVDSEHGSRAKKQIAERGKTAPEDVPQETLVPLKNLGQVRTAFKKKQYKSIAEAFPVLIQAKPKVSPKDKEELRFYYAESLYKTGKIQEAAVSYNEILQSHFFQSHQAKIQLRLGDCFQKLGEKDAAKVYYKELLSKHPKTAEAEAARNLLKKL